MYSLGLCYADEHGVDSEMIFYNDVLPIKEIALSDPQFSLETSKAGQLDFTVPECNLVYNLIEQMKTEVVVYNTGEEIWRGRVLESGKDFYNQKKVTVEGELAYLNDTFQPQIEYHNKSLYQFLDAVLTIHNEKVAVRDENEGLSDVWYKKETEPFNKAFVLGIVATVDESLDIMYRNTNYECTYDIIKKVVDDYKLKLVVRREIISGHIVRRVDFLKDFSQICEQTISFGMNLLDFDQTFKMENLCTVCMPIGAKITDNMAGDEVDTKDTFDETGYFNCIGSDGLPYNIGGSERKARFIKLSDYDIEAEDKVFFTTSVRSDDTQDPPSDYIYKDSIYSFLKYVPGTGWSVVATKSFSSRGGSESHTEAFKKEGVTVPEDATYFLVAGMTSEDTTEYKLAIYKQKKELEKLDEYFTIEKLREITEADGEGVVHPLNAPYLINPELLSKYGWIEKKAEYSELESLDQLYAKAKEYMTTTQFEQMVLNVTAYDLNILGINANNIWINMKVPIYSVPHGLTNPSFNLPCTKVVIQFNNPERNEYTLGYDSSDTLSNNMNNMNSSIKTTFDSLPGISDMMSSARENATQILEAFAGYGVVTFIRDEVNQEKVREIHIYNNENPDVADGRWVFNYGGIGFQKRDGSGNWGNIEIAMTNEGELVAKNIKSGIMYADLMYGGQLTLMDVKYTDEHGVETTKTGQLKVTRDPSIDPRPDDYELNPTEHEYDVLWANKDDGLVYQDHIATILKGGFIYGKPRFGHENDTTQHPDWAYYRTNFGDDDNPDYFLGRIRWDAGYEGRWGYGLEFTSKHIVLNCEGLSLATPYNGGGYVEALGNGDSVSDSKKIRYMTGYSADGGAEYCTLEFYHGILVAAYDENEDPI